MEDNHTVLIQPKKEKVVRIDPSFYTKKKVNHGPNDVIRKPPKPKGKESMYSSFAHSYSMPNIIIPKRKIRGFTDLADKVRC